MICEWPRDWDGVDDLLSTAEETLIFPACFACGQRIPHEDLVDALTVILATNRSSHRHCILINCPACGQEIAVWDPLRRREKEFAHAPTH